MMVIDGDDAGAGPAADRAASRRCGDPIAVYFFVLVCREWAHVQSEHGDGAGGVRRASAHQVRACDSDT